MVPPVPIEHIKPSRLPEKESYISGPVDKKCAFLLDKLSNWLAHNTPFGFVISFEIFSETLI